MESESDDKIQTLRGNGRNVSDHFGFIKLYVFK